MREGKALAQPRQKESLMATITRKNALECAIKLINTHLDAWEAITDEIDENPSDVTEVLAKMLDSMNKSRKSNDSRAEESRKANREMLDKYLDTHDPAIAITAKELSVEAGISTQKASAILRLGVIDGKLTSSYDKKKNVYHIVQ